MLPIKAKMKYVLGLDSCRVCLQKRKKCRSIYEPMEDGDEAPIEMLGQLMGNTIATAKEKDAFAHLPFLPHSICRSCELSMNLAFQFRKKALNSQRIIELLIQRNRGSRRNSARSTARAKIKMEMEMAIEEEEEEEPLDIHESLAEDCIQEDDLHQSNEEMKVEELEIHISDGKEEELSEHIEYSSENSIDEEDDTDVNEQHIAETLETMHDTEAVSSTKSGEPRTKCESTIALALVEDDAHVKTRITQGLPTETMLKTTKKRSGANKRVKDESGHMCDICGNIYQKRGRMMEHRRQHDGEPQFACELCDLRFQHREKLRKHMYMHSGRKPHKCSFCSRGFFYKSLKTAHEAIHAGHKPYVCDVCNKPFAYSQALKNHQLIHADIKLYHCDYCDKDFRLQHHMKQHEETKLHQMTVQATETAKADHREPQYPKPC